MKLEELGYNENLKKFRKEQKLEEFLIARVITEHKERYIVKTDSQELEAEITGNMRFAAESRSDYPAVGDWVAVAVYDELAIIHKIFPRKSILERRAVNKFGETQIIATNLDYAFIVQAVDRDFNVNRIERYLTICHSAKVEPVIILSKIDLINSEELDLIINEIKQRIKAIEIIPISNFTKEGLDKLDSTIRTGKTYCMLGSSGVGKSTLINNLAGYDIMRTNSISTSTNKGKHTTNYRELIVLDKGGIIIDNPGMREVGIADTGDGLEITFDNIVELAKECKFSDCTHTHEKECAVLDAVEKGIIDETSYKNYLKMEKEKIRFQTTAAEKKKKDKVFGRMQKEAVKYRRENKY